MGRTLDAGGSPAEFQVGIAKVALEMPSKPWSEAMCRDGSEVRPERRYRVVRTVDGALINERARDLAHRLAERCDQRRRSWPSDSCGECWKMPLSANQ